MLFFGVQTLFAKGLCHGDGAADLCGANAGGVRTGLFTEEKVGRAKFGMNIF